MTTNTFLADFRTEEGKDDFQWISQNRTLYADQFTEDGPVSDEDREAFQPKSMSAVFERFQPRKTGVQMEAEDGTPVVEDFEFREIKDFEDSRLIDQSTHLRKEKDKISYYDSIIHQLERNKLLKNALKDNDARANLEGVLSTLIAELEEANNKL